MTPEEELKVNVDKRGRVCDKQGRPLRDRAGRNFKGPFKGGEGAPHKGTARLQARIREFDLLRKQDGRTKPGSLKR